MGAKIALRSHEQVHVTVALQAPAAYDYVMATRDSSAPASLAADAGA